MGTLTITDFVEEISRLPFEEQLQAIRRHLHQHPEIGFQEVETSFFLQTYLQKLGLTPVGPLAKTGFYVEIKGNPSQPIIGYRADMDALPIQDEKSVPYASCVPGKGHLCGHDAHMTIALGIARLLVERQTDLKGTVRIFFQPNEEGAPSGAQAMVQSGILQEMQAIYAIHVDPTLPVGTFGLAAGPVTAASDGFTITIKGPGTGHSARPHQNVDTVWIAVQIMNTLYQIIGRLTDARNPAVLTFCLLRGGEALNVIPDEVLIGGTLRSIEPNDRIFLKEQIVHLSQDIAARYGGRATVDFRQGSPAVINHPDLIKHISEVITDIHGCGAIFEIPRPSMGSEDFAYYTEQIPGALVRVGTAGSQDTRYPLHDTLFDVDERALPIAARVMSEVLFRHLQQLPC